MPARNKKAKGATSDERRATGIDGEVIALVLPPVLYEDDAIMVLNKPAGLVVEKSHTHSQVTLQDLLPFADEVDRAGLVHRLDRDTSGVMVVAKTNDSQAALQKQFLERTTDKEYMALVWGKLADDHAVINAPIARHPKIGYKYVVMDGGRDAKTEFWRLGEYKLADDVASLIKVDLHTGRTHQIRVHMMAMGHALVGDTVYGRRKDKSAIRQFLHASKLSLQHPATGKTMTFEAPLADDLQRFLDGLKQTNE